jgi:signal transduction histidine kinase
VTPLPATPLSLPPLMTATSLAAFLFAMFGLIYLALWWRDRERGLLGLGTAALLVAVFYAADAMGLNAPRGVRIQAPVWVSLLLQTTIVSWALGLARYLGEAPSWQRPLVPLLLLPNVLLGTLVLFGWQPPRLWGNVALTSVFVGMAWLSWRARLREPGAGHGLIAASLVLMPVYSLVIALSHVEPMYLRYLAVPPLMVFFLTLLTVSLQRRRRALEAEVQRRSRAEKALAAMNDSLERLVAQRTADLHDMVAGLESFNRSVSHDLRGPLGGIEGLASLAAQAINRDEPDTARRMLAAIEGQARSSRELVGALLELARVGDSALQRSEVSLATLTREVIAEWQGHAGDAQQPCFVLGDLPLVQADPGLLRPALANLIGNACKFSQQATAPRVEVASRWREGILTVEVRDNGVGFSAEAATRLFHPFQRLHGKDFAGHGVGLSIVRRAVERHGGQVWAEAQPGQGARFFFTLPQAV